MHEITLLFYALSRYSNLTNPLSSLLMSSPRERLKDLYAALLILIITLHGVAYYNRPITLLPIISFIISEVPP